MHARGWMAGILSAALLAGCGILPDRNPVTPEEITRPQFMGITAPALGEIEVPLEGSVTFAFNEKVDPSSAYGAITIAHDGQEAVGVFTDGGSAIVDSTVQDTIVSGTDTSFTYRYIWSYYLEFDPTQPYDPASVYEVLLTGGVKDIHGNSLSIDPNYADSSWFFTEGDYSQGGWYPVYILDKPANSLLMTSRFDSAEVADAGLDSPADIAVSPNGQYVVVTNKVSEGYLSIYDPTLASRVDVPLDAGPEEVELDDSYAYVINTSANTISLVDLASASEVDRYSFDDGFDPGHFALDAENDRVIISSSRNNAPGLVKILRRDGDALSEAASVDIAGQVEIGRAAAAVVFSGGEVFLQEDLSANITVLDPATGEVLDHFSAEITEIADGDTTVVGNRGKGMAVVGGTGYMLTLDGFLVEIDLTGRTATRYLELPARVWDVGAPPTGDILFAAIANESNYTVVDPGSLRILGTATTSSAGKALAVGRVK